MLLLLLVYLVSTKVVSFCENAWNMNKVQQESREVDYTKASKSIISCFIQISQIGN